MASRSYFLEKELCSSLRECRTTLLSFNVMKNGEHKLAMLYMSSSFCDHSRSDRFIANGKKEQNGRNIHSFGTRSGRCFAQALHRTEMSGKQLPAE